MSKRLRSSEMCADCSGPGECPRPGPRPPARLPGTPAPRRPRGSRAPRPPCPAPMCPGARLGAAGAPRGREPSRACESRAGRGPPPSAPSGASRPEPCGAGRRRPGRGSTGRGWGGAGSPPQKSRARPPAAPEAQVPPPGPPPPEPPGALPQWATAAASLRRDQPADRGRLPAPGIRAPSPGVQGARGLQTPRALRGRRPRPCGIRAARDHAGFCSRVTLGRGCAGRGGGGIAPCARGPSTEPLQPRELEWRVRAAQGGRLTTRPEPLGTRVFGGIERAKPPLPCVVSRFRVSDPPPGLELG